MIGLSQGKAVVTVGGNPRPRVLRDGDSLPNGARLIKASPESAVFEIDGQRYTDAESASEMESEIDADYTLGQLITKEKTKFTYNYDFGDDWRHELVVEKILPPGEGVAFPICVDAAPGGGLKLARPLVLPDPPAEEETYVGDYMKEEAMRFAQFVAARLGVAPQVEV